MTSKEDVIHDLFGSEKDETSFGSEGSDENEDNPNSDVMRDARTEEAFEVMVRDGPQSGMLFESKERLYEAYHSYAKVKGFCIFSRNTSSNGNYCRMACDRGGKVCSKKYTKKTNCLARINAIRQLIGYWMVSSVCIEHNHDLDPSMSAFMPGHRHLTLGLKRQLEANDRAGIRICKNVKLMEVLAGGPENVGATAKDCRNFIDQRRRLRLGEGDAEAISQLFTRLQRSDARFFHLMDIDDHGRLRNLMWIHPRSIAAYEEFHDVVSFDTTYLVNQYQMPLATVVGVNHHNQSILLGCGLLTHEDGESFKWFFRNWLGAMGGVQPTAILTDQCDSIRIAVREVIPETVHRYCLWHILQKVPVKLKGPHDHRAYSNSLYRLIYDSLNISDFERRWVDFITEYGFQNNRWLRDLYSERENWVPVYLNHLFWAGMVSTQRSESMHAFFYGYVNSRSTLSIFVEQYEVAVKDKIQKELLEDYKSKCTSLQPVSHYKWEEHFARVYTNNVYKLLQEQIKLIGNCNVQEVVSLGEDNVVGVERFEVLELCMMSNYYHKQYTFTVEYRPNGEYISCTCRKFEFKGILCAHVLKVLVYKDMPSVNERYILRRWRKDVYRPHSCIVFTGGYPHMTREYKMFQEVEREFQQCTDLAYNSVEKMNFVKERCVAIKDALMNWDSTNASTDPVSSRTEERTSAGTPLLNPVVARVRGRPRGRRFTRGHGGRSNRGRGDGNMGTQGSVV